MPPPDRRQPYAGEPMTLGNMRSIGVRGLSVTCGALGCHHAARVEADHFPDALAIPALGRRFRCRACGHLGADTRPDWRELGQPHLSDRVTGPNPAPPGGADGSPPRTHFFKGR